ncbi:hypothetical protein [Tautonia sociabilis]|uniref:Uncharacterized protein n=1 Tax=Tautonia sociabilis TaxID=2080755 RepID=A0A432MQI4_9BACT|nr:hypothetical protein [Tautonia sociabilis]RUL89316.1 hypothetical protein TsocGM_02560 [Tautonia sociabilis]
MAPDQTRSTIPLGLLGALILVVAIEASRADRPIDRQTKTGLAWQFGAEAAAEPAVIGARVLCLGDSRMKLGVLPVVLEDRIGLPAYNLAVPGAPASATVILLEKALRAGAKPSLLVVNFDENLLAVSPRERVSEWPELLGPGDWLGLARRSGDLDFVLRVGLGMILPSWRDREAIRERIVAALGGRERPILPELRALDRNWRRNLGAQVATPGERVPSSTAFIDSGATPRSRGWRPHPINAQAVHRLCSLADRLGITVAWLLPPSRADWTDRRRSLGLTEAFDAFVAEVLDAHPNVVVVDGRSAGFPDAAFRDPTHLDGLGASSLSESLADALLPLLDRGRADDDSARLVALPAYRPPSSRLSLEDMATSAAMVRTR